VTGRAGDLARITSDHGRNRDPYRWMANLTRVPLVGGILVLLIVILPGLWIVLPVLGVLSLVGLLD